MEKVYWVQSLLFLLIISGCGRNNNSSYQEFSEENHLIFSDSLKLSESGYFSLMLDQSIGQTSNSMSYSSSDDVLSIFNILNHSLYLFNGENGKISSIIPLEFEGPNGVGDLGLISSHLIKSQKEIYLYNQNIGVLFKIDSSGVILNKARVTDYRDEANLPVPYPSTMRPFYVKGDLVFFPCEINNRLSDYSSYPAVLRYDLGKKEAKSIISFSSPYNEAYWGPYYKYQPSLTFGPKNNIYVSFPIDHTIYIMDSNGDFVDSRYVGSKFMKEFEPYQEDVEYWKSVDLSVADERERIHGYSTSEYRSILYDETNSLFYRICFIRPSEEEILNEVYDFDISIIIMDKNLNKVGESVYPSSKYNFDMIFLRKGELFVKRNDLSEKIENEIVFEMLKPEKL
ncbi:DUF4221 family protein [Algoriphagus hitonicola]|uniref:DUF4221 domain-containing protein n=1 Tax=Algoriphagus hitonicola TaxID=435880 RepID=A0A1I2NH54_9BACT|nr:DUF4221 family protein [Algoriphagus hitonicola]SFG03092.1 protein of unknown function [Algoriphagus hitonicola]